MRPDFIKALVNFVAGQFSALGKLFENDPQIKPLVCRIVLKNGLAANRKSVIDIAHLRKAFRFGISTDRSVFEPNIASIPSVIVPEDGHQGRLSALSKMGRHRLVINGQIGVAVKHEKIFGQPWQQLLDGSASTKEFIAIIRINDLYTELFTVPEKLL